MDFDLKPGLEAVIKETVTEEMTAHNFGSGEVNVLATPVMIGFMEHASLNAVDKELPAGYATVGFTVNIKHLAPTPVGMAVSTKARLIEVEGRKLTFEVYSEDGAERVGEGTHIRYIVEMEKLQHKAEAKK